MSPAVRLPLRGSIAAGHPLIDEVSDLTQAWLTAVLRGAGVLTSGQVIAARTESVGNGMVAATVRIHLSYDAMADATAPATLVAKMTSIHEASHKTGVALSVYEKEVRFYQDIAPDVPTSISQRPSSPM